MKLSREEFEALVAQALAAVPKRFQKLLNNVVVVVEEYARPEQRHEVGIPHGHLLLGLYQGVPQTQRGPNYSLVLPDKITIFQNTIEEVGQTDAGIRELVRETVWHELAHHFGSDELRIRRAERRRKSEDYQNS